MSKADEIMMAMATGAEAPKPEPENTNPDGPEVNPDGPLVDESTEVEPGVEPQVDPEVEVPAVEPVTPNPDPDPEPGTDPQSVEEGDVDVFGAWDEDVTPSGETDDTEINFSDISNAIGIEDEVEGKESFVQSVKDKFSSYEQKIKDLSGNQMPDNIPDALKEAVKIAASGGDYSAYISASSMDYDAISDVDLVANALADHFTDTNGNVNKEELGKYLDDMSDKQIEIEARSIRNALESTKQAQMQEVKTQAIERRNAMMSSIKSELDKFTEFNGFKVMPHHKDRILQGFSEDKVIQAIFYDRGEFSAAKAVAAYFQHLYGKKINDALVSRIKNKTKKEIIDQVTNPEIDKPSSAPNPPEEGPKTGLDSWLDQLKG